MDRAAGAGIFATGSDQSAATQRPVYRKSKVMFGFRKKKTYLAGAMQVVISSMMTAKSEFPQRDAVDLSAYLSVYVENVMHSYPMTKADRDKMGHLAVAAMHEVFGQEDAEVRGLNFIAAQGLAYIVFDDPGGEVPRARYFHALKPQGLGIPYLYYMDWMGAMEQAAFSIIGKEVGSWHA